jgi:hypothetical protein
MPSELLVLWKMSFHFAPASITPGIAVIVTSFAGAGWGKLRGGGVWLKPMSGASSAHKKQRSLAEDIN